MLSDIKDKIRALVGDFGTCSSEQFEYTTSNVFRLCANNVTSIESVVVQGVELDEAEYSFNSTTNQLTITATMNTGDIIDVSFCSYKYSESELEEYIKASLVHISTLTTCTHDDYEIESEEIYPTPTNKTEDLIALVSSIIIQPNYSSYSLPNLKVTYPKTMDKQRRIKETIKRFYRGLGKICNIEIVEWE